MAAAGLMVAGFLSPGIATVILLPISAAYAIVLALPHAWLAHVNPLLGGVPQNLIEVPYEATHDRPVITHQSCTPVLLLPIPLTAVVVGSYPMAHHPPASTSLLH